MTLLYDAVAAGMWAYSRTAFRVTTLGPARLELEPGTLVVSTHRRETDVPVLGPSLYARAGLWRRRHLLERLSFAARDDLFLAGFFAGFPPGLPPLARRALFPVGVGRRLNALRVYPLRSASVARLGEVVRELPDGPLAEVVPAHELALLSERATDLHRPAPVRGDDVLRGEYADILWRAVSRSDVTAKRLDGFWGRRAALAAADFRALAELVRDGGILVVFPEGRPSPDGEIGPIQRGLAALVRRARPSALQPVALAYDPLVRGRTRAFVSFGDAIEPPAADIGEAVLGLLRRTVPLTVGQVVADVLEREPGADLEAALLENVERARSRGRPVEPGVADWRHRRARLDEALAAAARRPQAIPYLAREHRSAQAA